MLVNESAGYDKDTENGSYLKQLMMNLDKSPFGILNKKSFSFGEASGAGFILEPIQIRNGGVEVGGELFDDWFATMAGKLDIRKWHVEFARSPVVAIRAHVKISGWYLNDEG